MNRSRSPGWVPALLVDLVAVTVFVGIGRSSHGEALGATGLASTAWPFLVALLAGWLAARAWLRPYAVAPTGVVIWAVTVAGGMVLRRVGDQGTAPAFVLVAAVVLGAFLVGWRGAVALAGRRSRAQASPMP